VESEAEPSPREFIPTDEFPQVVSRVTPEYPDLPRTAGAEGRVLVRLLIGVDGRVRRAEIEQSAPLFDDAALAATRQWTFTPAKANGHPVMVWIRIPVQFTLH
jgi:protein TonB